MSWTNSDWTCDNQNAGYPYITAAGVADVYDPSDGATVWALRSDILMGYPHILVVFPPAPHGAVPHVDIPRPLMVYAPETRDFSGNGFACLRPTSAEWLWNFGEAGEVTVTHPVDSSGVWSVLQPNIIIGAPTAFHGVLKPQGFRIYRVVKSMDSAGRKTVTAYARHVFYDLNYGTVTYAGNHRAGAAIEAAFQNQVGYSGTPYINKLASDAWYSRDDGQTTKNFKTILGGSLEPINWEKNTITEALLGDGGVSQIWGLELYVDNFYFSLQSLMENAKTDSFVIRYSHDMTGVTEDRDYTAAFTHMFTSDNFGDGYGVSTAEEAYGPFARPTSISFSYSNSAGGAQDNLNRLTKDATDYWNANHTPTVSYTASYAPLDKQKGLDFIGQLDGRDVGDTGTVINSDLGISTTQRIISKRVDLLTGITLEIALGNLPAYLTRRSAWSSTATQGAPSSTEKQIEALRNA